MSYRPQITHANSIMHNTLYSLYIQRRPFTLYYSRTRSSFATHFRTTHFVFRDEREINVETGKDSLETEQIIVRG